MARGNSNLMPMSTDDKPLMLQKLQGSIHFEKTLPAAAAASSAKKFSGLTLPSWFVQKHGDKFRKSTILRMESSTEPWPVTLTIWITSPTQTQVYVFRSTERPYENPSRKQKRCTYNSTHSREKGKQPYRKCGDHAHLSANEEGSDEGKHGSSSKSSAIYDSAIAPTPPSCKEDSLHHLPSFGKTLTATNVRGDGLARLEFPAHFCEKYANRIHSVIKLQGIHEQSPARTMTCYTSFGKDIRHYMKAGWRAFLTENHLHEGQQLVFTLSADSSFVVRERSAL